MALRAVLSLQIGPDTVMLGPPTAFGGRPDGNQIGKPGRNGREDARRWINRLCQDSAARDRIRREMIHWMGDPHHVNRISHAQLANTLVELCAAGKLAMWTSRPLSSGDPKLISTMDTSTQSTDPIEIWSLPAKVEWVLHAAADNLTGVSRDEYLEITGQLALPLSTGIMVLWASSLVNGPGEIVDVVLHAAQSHRFDRSAVDVARTLSEVITDISAAQNQADLASAAQELAALVTLIGVGQFKAMLLISSRKAKKGAVKPKTASLRASGVR